MVAEPAKPRVLDARRAADVDQALALGAARGYDVVKAFGYTWERSHRSRNRQRSQHKPTAPPQRKKRRGKGAEQRRAQRRAADLLLPGGSASPEFVLPLTQSL